MSVLLKQLVGTDGGFDWSILVGWLECRFWMQRWTVRTPAAVCCFLELDALSALLQSTQL